MDGSIFLSPSLVNPGLHSYVELSNSVSVRTDQRLINNDDDDLTLLSLKKDIDDLTLLSLKKDIDDLTLLSLKKDIDDLTLLSLKKDIDDLKEKNEHLQSTVTELEDYVDVLFDQIVLNLTQIIELQRYTRRELYYLKVLKR